MRTAALCAALSAAACGASLSNVVAGSSPSPSAVLFDCASREAERLEFDRQTYDKRELRLVVTRRDPEVRSAETTFRRGFDQLTVRVRGGDQNAGSSMQVTARSFLEYFDRTGVRVVEREATSGALGAAETLLRTCTGGGMGEEEAPAGGEGDER